MKLHREIFFAFVLSSLPVVIIACTPSQQQTAKTVASTALALAQAACAKIPEAQAIAAANLRGGAANTVSGAVAIANATCDVANLAALVEKDPTTHAFVDGLGAAIVAATAPAKP